mgnify:CR=1 FL=1
MVIFTENLMRHVLRISFSILTACLFLICCQKDDILTDSSARLEFSTDTIYFDTVLVSLGSLTHYFTVVNPYDQPLEISRIHVAGGDASFFRLNVNGINGNELRNVKIARKDSIYIFVEVTIDPLNTNNPLLIKDSVIFDLNSRQQDVKLIAYGQDVILFRNEVFRSQSWTSDKPYLIVDNAALDFDETLTIGPGTKIFLTPNSSLLVWGTIQAAGTYENPIVFSGARFDGGYEETAGQWGTIFIHEKSTGNSLQNVIIKNAVAGLQVGYPVEDCIASVELNNCIILNSAGVGIYAFSSNINAYNTIIADCGTMAVLIQMGGNYNFYHCTISNVAAYYPNSYYEGNYGRRSSSQPSLVFTNYYTGLDLDEDYRIIESTIPQDLHLNFYNSIIDGVLDNEVYFDTLNLAGLDYIFDHCMLKVHKDTLHIFDTNRFVSVIYSEDPLFLNDSIAKGPYDFTPGINSPAIDAGNPLTISGIPQLLLDFAGNPRNVPDIGAIEQTEQ